MDKSVPVQPEYVEAVRLLLEQMVYLLIDQPGLASVGSTTHANLTRLNVVVSHADLGKIVGKQGRTARSLRTILAAASMEYKHRFILNIKDSSDSNLPSHSHLLSAVRSAGTQLPNDLAGRITGEDA